MNQRLDTFHLKAIGPLYYNIQGQRSIFCPKNLVYSMHYTLGCLQGVFIYICTLSRLRCLQHPVRDRDVRVIFQDGFAPHVVAVVSGLFLLLRGPHHAHHLLLRSNDSLVGGPHSSTYLRLLCHLHEIQPKHRVSYQKTVLQKSCHPSLFYRSTGKQHLITNFASN